MELLPELPEQSQAKIGVIANLAKANIEEARRQLDLAHRAKRVEEMFEWSVGRFEERAELRAEHEDRDQAALQLAQTAALELFDIYSAEYWQLLSPDLKQFSDLLPALRNHVEREIACRELTTTIRDVINERAIWWVRKIASEILQGSPRAETPTSPFTSDTRRPDNAYKTPLAQNIENLRRECGWSVSELSQKTGLDKKLVSGHLQGKGAHPRTIKTYADAFTKNLGRTVSVNELNAPPS
jgi:hypothetical protein